MTFPLESYLTIAHYLIKQDETERALQVLELLPAQLRDQKPKPIDNLKQLILNNILTGDDYAEDPSEEFKNTKTIDLLARGKIIKDYVREMNEKSITPHIVDFGPGDYWLPFGLKDANLKFTYKSIALHKKVQAKARDLLGDYWKDKSTGPTVFVAFEVIEHMHKTQELQQAFIRHCPDPIAVFLSTPKYTFGQGTPDFEKSGIQHLRAYTPREFVNEGQSLFYNAKQWHYYDDTIMVIRGDF